MKKETEELINWLKDHLLHYRNQLAAGQIKVGLVTGDKEEKNAYKAIHFLDSLNDIEYRLGKGGYIPDINGTACKYGDSVKILNKTDEFGGDITGRLVWSDIDKCFYVDDIIGRKRYHFPLEFEKYGVNKW